MEVTDDLTGLNAGNYRIERHLGEGAFADVYLGIHRAIDSRVAIKVLKPDLQGKMTERFVNEARVVNHINHPNIVKIFDFGSLPDERLYLIMEYLEGNDLNEMLRKNGKLRLDEMLFFLRQIASALDATHECEVVHQDLKPASLFYPHLPAVCERFDGSSRVIAELEGQLDLIYY